MNPQNAPEDLGGAPAKKRMNPIRLVIVLIIVVLAVLLILQNSASASVKLFGWSFTLPGWLWITILVLLGVIIGSVFPWGRRRKKVVK
jgi:uncharacterized integral membrane protein